MMKLWLVMCTCMHLVAQDVSFDVLPRNIGINEQVQFSIEVKGNDNGRTPTFPNKMELGDFRLLNDTPSVSTSFSMVNGRSSSSKTFTFTLGPTKKGSLEFPGQTIIINGKTFTTPPVKVEVGEQNLSVTRRDPFSDLFNSRRSQKRQPRQKGEVFGAVEVPKNDFYLGEPIPMDVMIYISPFLYVVGRDSAVGLPDLTDFWVEDIVFEPTDPIELTRNGTDWKRYTVYRKRLFANKTGELTIPSATFQLSISDNPRFGVFGGTRANRNSEPLTLTIKPLPKAGKPRGFSGLVGNFKAKGQLDAEEIKVGETVNLTFEVTGTGNFSAMSDLSLTDLKDFEIFSGGLPSRDDKGNDASKTWAFALVAKREGTYQIPMPKLAYFDPISETYKTIGGNAYSLKVTPGKGLGEGAVISGGNAGPLVAEKNINFIMVGDLDQVGKITQPSDPLNLVKLAVVFVILDLLVFFALLVQSQLAGRRSGQRHTYALKNFRRGLTKLKNVGEDADAYYGGLNQTVLAYFGDKWDREGQGLSLDAIRDRMDRAQVPDALYDKLAEVIEACDLARFTPSTSASRENLMNKAREVIEEIEGAMK